MIKTTTPLARIATRGPIIYLQKRYSVHTTKLLTDGGTVIDHFRSQNEAGIRDNQITIRGTISSVSATIQHQETVMYKESVRINAIVGFVKFANPIQKSTWTRTRGVHA